MLLEEGTMRKTACYRGNTRGAGKTLSPEPRQKRFTRAEGSEDFVAAGSVLF
jgi:hypothetical protein